MANREILFKAKRIDIEKTGAFCEVIGNVFGNSELLKGDDE